VQHRASHRKEAGFHSGVGRVGGPYAMETSTELKTVILNLN